MAKKATTIILFIVVLLLLGSTVYVSIILTSEDSAPTTLNTRASETEDDLAVADDPFAESADAEDTVDTQTDTDPLREPQADSLADPLDPLAQPTEDPLLQTNDQLDQTTVDPAMEQDPSTEVDPATDPSSEGQDLAYLNPTPMEDEQDVITVEEDVFSEPQTTGLPETGKGQAVPSTSPSPTFAPTMAASATPMKVEPTQTVSLPTAGFGIGIVTSLIAGVTILASLFL